MVRSALGVKSVLSLCNPSGKLVCTVIVKIVHCCSGRHHSLPCFLPHFLIRKHKTLAHRHLQWAGLGARTQRVRHEKGRGWLYKMTLTRPEPANQEPTAPQTGTSKMKTVGRKWEWSRVWMEPDNRWTFIIKVQQSENPLLISWFLLVIHFFPLSPYLLLTFNLPDVSSGGQFMLK